MAEWGSGGPSRCLNVLCPPGGWLGNRSVDGVTAGWDCGTAGFGWSEPLFECPMPIVFLIENSAGKAVPAMRVELAWREQSNLPWEVAQSDVSGQGRIRFRSLGRELMGLRVGIGLSAELVPVSIEEVIASEGELKVVVQ